jgi:hypothetical protein
LNGGCRTYGGDYSGRGNVEPPYVVPKLQSHRCIYAAFLARDLHGKRISSGPINSDSGGLALRDLQAGSSNNPPPTLNLELYIVKTTARRLADSCRGWRRRKQPDGKQQQAMEIPHERSSYQRLREAVERFPRVTR